MAKPSRGTSPDKRLKRNRPKSPKKPRGKARSTAGKRGKP
jgi:hypothetical protein